MRRLGIVLSILLLTLTSVSFAEEAKPICTLNRPVMLADYGDSHIWVLDKDGNVTWDYECKNPIDVWVLPSGNYLFSHVGGAMELTPDKKIVWRFDTAEGNEVHACQPLPDGLVLVAESGPMRLVEVDRDGKVTKTIPLQTKIKRAHLQMRGVRKLANGNYLVGQWGDNICREYDGNGKIVREFPHKEAYGGIRLKNGNTLVATGDAHRIVEFDADGKEVWIVEENELPGIPLRFVAGLQRLPNGNTMICNWGGHGHDEKQAQLVEITPDKKIVGQLYDFKRFGTIAGVFVIGLDADPTRFESER
jgi:outer membrane protein assembly factor BamB